MYNLGDKSLIFKYISKNLKNLYDSTIKISDEYSLDLAKSIYSFLRDKFPSQDVLLADGTVLTDTISDYYLSGNPHLNKMTPKTLNVDYSYYSGILSFAPNSQPNNGSLIYVYYTYNGSEYFSTYIYNSNEPDINVFDSPSELNTVGVVDFKELGYIPDSRGNTSYSLLGARVYKSIDVTDYTKQKIYDTDKDIIPTSILDINKYNIKSWPINDQVLQYLQPGIVICEEFSSLDEIAMAQAEMRDAREFQYEPISLGSIDNAFIKNCYLSQKYYSNNRQVLITAYFDTYVESTIRHYSEVHK